MATRSREGGGRKGKKARRRETEAPRSPAASPGFLLWRATNLWQRGVREALREVELTHVQFVLLAGAAWLTREGVDGAAPGSAGVVSQAQLAQHAGSDVMMTSQVVRELERRALLERAPHPIDRRARALAVTPAGRSLLERARPLVERADAGYFAPLGGRLPKLTRRLRDLVDGAAGER